MLDRLARFSFRRRWFILAAWAVLLVVVSVLSSKFGGEPSISFRLDGTDSQQALDLLRKSGSSASNEIARVVFAADDVTTTEVSDAGTKLLDRLAKVEHVESVVSPFTDAGALQVSKSKKVAFAQVTFDEEFQNLPATLGPKIEKLVEKYQSDAVQVELSGNVFAPREIGGASEIVGLIAAVIILLLAFGSVLAMGLPIAVALFGIGIGLGGVALWANVVTTPNFAAQLAAMIGIGVGIDYALFIVTRYRQLLHSGLEPEEAVARAIRTAGKAVLFAGCTVVISLLGMFLMRLSFVNGLAVSSSFAVLVTMLASVTLLPALLGFVGYKIDALALPWVKSGEATERNVWYRWSRTVQRRPVIMATLGLAVLVGLAIPFTDIRLGNADNGNLPTSSTLRRSYDLLSEGFGPGFNGIMLVAVSVPNDDAGSHLTDLYQAVASTKGVSFAIPASWESGDKVAVIPLFPTTSPQSTKTVDLIHLLREKTLPAAVKGTGLTAHVGGATALFEDVAETLGHRLPLFIGGVLAVSFLLLLAVFRSVFVPLKAVIVNLLSIAASYGLLVLVFQKGVGAGLLGTGEPGPIESFVPMMMFAIVFGLSMDYEVFLLSRVKEEYDITGDNAGAVADGLSHTARVITAAAAIMVCVFGSFFFGDLRVIKEFGFGLAVAVLIDATLVRMVLVPATMELLGDLNWWFPRWLDRIVPAIHIEGEA